MKINLIVTLQLPFVVCPACIVDLSSYKHVARWSPCTTSQHTGMHKQLSLESVSATQVEASIIAKSFYNVCLCVCGLH